MTSDKSDHPQTDLETARQRVIELVTHGWGPDYETFVAYANALFEAYANALKEAMADYLRLVERR